MTNRAWTSTLSEEEARAVRTACDDARAHAWQLIEALVNTDSSPEHLDGLAAVSETMAAAWQRLGFEVATLRTPAGLPVLDARRGTGSDGPKVLVLTHLDTVFPPGTAEMRPFRRQEGRATGPGVADAKGAAATAWLGIAAAISVAGLSGLDLRVLANTDEEAGSVESRAIIEAAARGADLTLVFEPGRPDGSVVIQRRGASRYRIEVAGRAAHTGVEPWVGANAIEELAHKILDLQRLNDRERLISVTVAMVRGGMRINTVPDHAEIDVDVRIPDHAASAEVRRAVEASVARNRVPGCSAQWHLLNERPPMVPQPAVEPLTQLYQRAAELTGLSIEATATGGGSDGCFTSALGVPTLDALGAVGGGYHTDAEFITESTLVDRAAAFGAFLTGLNLRSK